MKRMVSAVKPHPTRRCIFEVVAEIESADMLFLLLVADMAIAA
jgi:hypothetical protein